jgi:DNA primase catalytic subunit
MFSWPGLALTWYMSGGCWSLALALHEETGLPIEVYYRGGRPAHAYVVDGESALDARGRYTS